MPRCTHDEAWTLADLPQGVFASRLRNSALEYHRAAESLFGDNLVKSPPAYFCATHAIELTLKSYLAACGLKRADMRKDGHCLECLYATAKDRDLNPEGHDYSSVMHHLRQYTVLHRYPDFMMDQVITPGDVMETSAVMLRSTETKVMKAWMREASKGGTYDIDIFSHGVEKSG